MALKKIKLTNNVEKLKIIKKLCDQRKTAAFYRPIPAKKLAAVCNIKEKHDTCPRVRRHIKELIEEGVPIASNSQGYFILKTAHETQRHLNKLLQLQVSIANRINAIYRAATINNIL